MLLPIVVVSLIASIAVAAASYALGDRWTADQLDSRYEAIEATLSEGSFPVNRQILRSLAQLTDTDLIAARNDGQVVQSSLDDSASLSASHLADIMDQGPQPPTRRVITIGDHRFRYGWFRRKSNVSRYGDDGPVVVVLFNDEKVRSASLRAAGLPLATGLSTVVLLGSIMLGLTGRLVRRLSMLRRQVDRVAEGHFDAKVPLGEQDEIAMLGIAVSRMAHQLSQMWQSIHRQQGQKLLHQVAGGLAHQLRNSLTGATMAIQIHQRECPAAKNAAPDESLNVALNQLAQTEAHVRRLLQVASGKQEADQRQSVADCLDDIRPTLDATASHWRKKLDWQITGDVAGSWVADGPSLASAIANLVLNAIEAAESVQVRVTCGDTIQVDVIDDGPGPTPQVADNVFEPFVTSKPEGLGLGLPLVARSARRLGGSVEWTRENDRTRFTLVAEITPPSESAPPSSSSTPSP
ncbi:sensor histidine kinase [Rubripirellula lacrimiformis]|uniref:sensor histidine kinase n=1 Tax=Rubripirellula lacrimiformis TaxID=1930273 RepID=UPI0011A91102|nr:HAMP domain-containing sensor histidine kinase [Rubripirellula lacrimiformis]